MRRRPIGRRGPGLLGVAAVGGTAYVAGKAGANKAAAEQQQNQQIADLQAQQAQQQSAAPPVAEPPQAPTTTTDDRIRQLRELAKLKEAGVLTDADVEREKDRILHSG
jgi:hypothetical protein